MHVTSIIEKQDLCSAVVVMLCYISLLWLIFVHDLTIENEMGIICSEQFFLSYEMVSGFSLKSCIHVMFIVALRKLYRGLTGYIVFKCILEEICIICQSFLSPDVPFCLQRLAVFQKKLVFCFFLASVLCTLFT